MVGGWRRETFGLRAGANERGTPIGGIGGFDEAAGGERAARRGGQNSKEVAQLSSSEERRLYNFERGEVLSDSAYARRP